MIADQGRWKLKPTLAREWQSLESNLRAILDQMLDLAHGDHPSDLIELWAYPNMFGYHGTYKSEAEAQMVACKA